MSAEVWDINFQEALAAEAQASTSLIMDEHSSEACPMSSATQIIGTHQRADLGVDRGIGGHRACQA